VRKLVLILLILGFRIGDLFAQSGGSGNIPLVRQYLQAGQKNKEKISRELIRQNVDFDWLSDQIKKGKSYRTDQQTGFMEHNFINKIGVEHPNLIFVPYKYDPARKYQVRIFMHGGVSSLEMRKWVQLINRTDTVWNSVNTINLYPASWALSKWWSYSQYENLSELLAFVKDNYNIDENQVSVRGVSDGGTGIFYQSNFYQTPFSCYLPLIGSMQKLSFLTDKQFYIRNYQGLSFFIVNGRKDEIFDISYVIPSVHELQKTAKEVNFTVIDSARHNTNWYPVLKNSIENFIKTHPRNPFPDQVYYATEKPAIFNRKFWVIIDRIGKEKLSNMDDINTIILDNQPVLMFPRGKLFGQIEVTKSGNTVQVRTQNVKNYTLLISPDHFDLQKPITVYTNNLLSFQGILPNDLRTLLKYNILDNDRAMLYSSELKITVGKTWSEKKKN
jgi:transposase-like protein